MGMVPLQGVNSPSLRVELAPLARWVGVIHIVSSDDPEKKTMAMIMDLWIVGCISTCFDRDSFWWHFLMDPINEQQA